MSTVLSSAPPAEVNQKSNRHSSPPDLKAFAHVSFPCRDLEEAKRFYGDVLGGRMTVDAPNFASFEICGIDVGVGAVGCTFLEPGAEYPHAAFFCEPRALSEWKEWLTGFGIPTSNFWTRMGVETLMFFRDPSGNVLELFCEYGFEGAQELPRGPARGHGTTVDIDSLRYTNWKVPA